MNTKRTMKVHIKNKDKKISSAPRVRSLVVNREVNSITELVETMRNVSLTSKEAKINATSISDNNGGRIELEKDDYIKR